MKLEVGKKYRLRDGTVAKVVGIDPREDLFPIKILLPDGSIRYRTMKGEVNIGSGARHYGDIVAPFDSKDDHGCTDAEVRAAVAEETLRCIKQIVGEVKELSDSVTRDRLFAIHDILS